MSRHAKKEEKVSLVETQKSGATPQIYRCGAGAELSGTRHIAPCPVYFGIW